MRSLWILFLSILMASARRGERPRYRTAYACEGSDLHIKCDEGHLIRLIRANYGRFSISICNEHGNLDWSVDCMSPISFRVMQQSCGMKKTCSLPASSTKFGDPCPDTVKYLEAHYQCVPESTTTVSTKPSPPILFLPTMPNNMYSTAVTSQKVPDTSTTVATKVITVSSEIISSEENTPSIASIVQTSTLPSSLPTESTVIGKATKKPTHATHQPPIHEVSPEQHCAAVRARNLIWNRTGAGITAKQQCPAGATGEAQWYCDSETSKWNPKQPDMSACKSLWLISLRERLSFSEAPENKITFSIINIAAELAVMARAKTLYGKDLIQMTEIIQQLVLKMAKRISDYPDSRQRYQIVKELVQSIVDICNSLLDDFHTDAWNDLSELERRTVVSALLREMEQSALLLAESLMISGEKHFNRVQSNVLVTATIMKVNTVSSTRLPNVDDVFGTAWARMEDFIFIPRQALLDSARNGLVKIIYIAYKKVDSILNSSAGRGKGSYEASSSEMENIMPIINSRIVTASLGQTSITRLSEPIAIILKNTLQQDNVSDPRCVFWSFDQRSWSEEGCWVQTFNRSHTVCNCNHFTNFAILRGVNMIQLTYKNEVALQVITYVGCIVSIVCLLVSIMTFQIFRVLKSDHIIIRKNLCICLLIAEAIFMGGINQTHLYIICGVIAGLLHYFFLAAFAWMFWEGFHIYLILSEVFETEKSRIKWYYAIAYTFPAMIVGICAAIDPSSYGTHRHCWLRADNYFLFTFVGPAIFIILASVFFLGYSAFIVCCPITQNSSVKAKEQTKLSNVKIMIRDAVLLVILLTLTWTFGLMYLNEESVVMAYIFTTLNTLQGIFIFLFHCVRNDKVQREYQKFVHRAQWLPECIKNTKSGDHCSSFYIHSNRTVTAPPTSTTHSLSHQSWDLQKEQPSTSSSALHSAIAQDQPPLTNQQRLSREKSLSRGIQGTQKKHNLRVTMTTTTTKNLPNRTEQGVNIDYPVECNCDKVVVAANLHAQQPERMVITPYSHMMGHGERCHSYVDHIYETIDDELDLPCCERRLFPYDSHGVVPEGHIRTHSDASRQSSSSFNCDHHPLLPPNLPQRNALTALAQVLNSAPRHMSTLTQNLYCQKCPEDSSCIHQPTRVLDPREVVLAHEHDKTCSTLPIHSLRGTKDDPHLRNVLTFSHSDRVPWNSTLPDVTRLSNDSAVVMAVLDGEHVVCKLQSDIANRSKCQTSNDPAHHLTTDC